MAFVNGVKNIQAAAYNGARTVYVNGHLTLLKSQPRKAGRPKLV